MTFRRNRRLLGRDVNGRGCRDFTPRLDVDHQMRLRQLRKRIVAARARALDLFVLRCDGVDDVGLMTVCVLCLALLRNLFQCVMQLLRLPEAIDRFGHIPRGSRRAGASFGCHQHSAVCTQHAP